jgi:hypothetical protein
LIFWETIVDFLGAKLRRKPLKKDIEARNAALKVHTITKKELAPDGSCVAEPVTWAGAGGMIRLPPSFHRCP